MPLINLTERTGVEGEAQSMPLPEQLGLWLFVAIGVFFSAWVVSKSPTGIEFSWVRVVFALFISFLVFAQVYDRLKASADAPFLVKASVAVQSGAFWNLLVDAVGTEIS
jgi:hypothetical protein